MIAYASDSCKHARNSCFRYSFCFKQTQSSVSNGTQIFTSLCISGKEKHVFSLFSERVQWEGGGALKHLLVVANLQQRLTSPLGIFQSLSPFLSLSWHALTQTLITQRWRAHAGVSGTRARARLNRCLVVENQCNSMFYNIVILKNKYYNVIN